ncbi:flavin-containing monooxygenase [Saccharopolyspora shandongensis]|uniref:flavin-containing monooxygenase n=1 Tax=Saccharopolyspora shandongensis TaxID=418495 RepID=UPI0033D9440F
MVYRPDRPLSDDALLANLDSAQAPALLMLTAHVTGEVGVLRPEWRPDLAKLPEGGYAPETAASIRDHCRERLLPLLGSQAEWPGLPEDSVRRAICSWLMGEDSEDAQALAEVAFTPDQADPRAADWDLAQVAPERTLRAVVIGAGFSGLLAALRLKQAGVPFTILEKSSNVAGTWAQNTYPNCRTDVPSYVYTYTFVPHDWETYFGTQQAIFDYLNEFALKNGLLEHVRFDTEVTATHWDAASASWTVETRTADGDVSSTEAEVVVSAVGQLSRPLIPRIEGLDTFEGPVVHSAEWDHDLDFTGKRVAVIGTGASALQFAPAVARDAAQVTIFQRSAPWLRSTPELRKPIDPAERWLFAHLNHYRAYYRFSVFLPRLIGNLPAATVDPDYPPTEVSVSAANDQLRIQLTDYLIEQAGDRRDLLEKIIPDYPPAAKRIIRDDGTWVSTLKRDNVRLIGQAVQRIDKDGVWSGDEHVPADIILLGTGFRASEFLMPMKVTGVDGQDLHETWGIDASAYMGITLPGFPNFFCMYGPNTNTVIHGNLVFFLECQAAYMLSAVRLLASGGHTSMDLRPDVFADYNDEVTEESAKRAWGWSKTHSWYQNAAGRSTIMWPLPARTYYERTREVRTDDYRLS